MPPSNAAFKCRLQIGRSGFSGPGFTGILRAITAVKNRKVSAFPKTGHSNDKELPEHKFDSCPYCGFYKDLAIDETNNFEFIHTPENLTKQIKSSFDGTSIKEYKF